MDLNLDLKEKVALTLGLLAVALVVVLAIYVPLGPRKWYLESQEDLVARQEELKMQLLFKADEAERLRKQKVLMEKIESRPPDFSLFTFLDNLLNTTKLRGRAQLDQYKARNLSPKQPMVQLRLQGVSFEELVDFLYKIYSSGNLIAVYKMDYLRPSPTEKGLDCDITFATLTL